MPNQLSAKNRVEKDVLGVIIDGLNSGDLPIDQAQQAAKETLATISRIEQHEDSILDFYKKLADKYPVFKILYTRNKDEVIRSRELSDYRKALSALDAGDVAQAHQIVKSAISQTADETVNVK